MMTFPPSKVGKGAKKVGKGNVNNRENDSQFMVTPAREMGERVFEASGPNEHQKNKGRGEGGGSEWDCWAAHNVLQCAKIVSISLKFNLLCTSISS